MNNCTISINMGNEVVIVVPVEAKGPVITKRDAYGLAMLKVYDANHQLSTLINKLSPLSQLYNNDMITLR